VTHGCPAVDFLARVRSRFLALSLQSLLVLQPNTVRPQFMLIR
jgi:hypothetical protein